MSSTVILSVVVTANSLPDLTRLRWAYALHPISVRCLLLSLRGTAPAPYATHRPTDRAACCDRRLRCAASSIGPRTTAQTADRRDRSIWRHTLNPRERRTRERNREQPNCDS